MHLGGRIPLGCQATWTVADWHRRSRRYFSGELQAYKVACFFCQCLRLSYTVCLFRWKCEISNVDIRKKIVYFSWTTAKSDLVCELLLWGGIIVFSCLPADVSWRVWKSLNVLDELCVLLPKWKKKTRVYAVWHRQFSTFYSIFESTIDNGNSFNVKNSPFPFPKQCSTSASAVE